VAGTALHPLSGIMSKAENTDAISSATLSSSAIVSDEPVEIQVPEEKIR